MSESMSQRIAFIRKSNHLSQLKFSERIGLTRNFIAMIETGRRIPSNRTISDICREFSINEEWLRTGNGEMQPSRAQKLGTYLSEIVITDDEFIKSFLEIYMELDDSSKKVLKEIALKMGEKIRENKTLNQT